MLGEIINRNKRNSEGTGFHVGGSEGVGLKVEKGEIEGVYWKMLCYTIISSQKTTLLLISPHFTIPLTS